MHLIRILTGLYLIVCVAVDLWADNPVAIDPASATATPATVLQAERDAEERLLKSLQKQINVDWKAISLREALNRIAKEIDGDLWINDGVLEDEGINAEQIVNLTLGKASLWQALHFLLEPRGMAWVPARGILQITSSYEVDEIVVNRVYDIRRIVEALEPDLQGTQSVRRVYRGAVASAGELELRVPFDDPFSSASDQSQMSRLGRRVAAENHCSVEVSLKELLGGIGVSDFRFQISDSDRVETRYHQLMVRGPYSRQWKVQGILEALETLLTNPGKANGCIAHRPGYPVEEDQAAYQALARTRRFNVAGMTLHEALRTMIRDQGIRVVIDEVSLSDEGISLDAPVTEPATETSLSVMLQRILQPLGAGVKVEEGTIVVQTEAVINEQDLIGIYDMKGIPEAVNPRGLMYLMERSTSDGGFAIRAGSDSAFLLSPRYFVARQTRGVHVEVDSLLTAMRQRPDQMSAPTAPSLETHIYAVLDSSAIGDLLESLPELIPDWDAKRGSIHRLGQLLAIKQFPAVHAQVGEIVGALNTRHQLQDRLKPATSPPAASPSTAPAK